MRKLIFAPLLLLAALAVATAASGRSTTSTQTAKCGAATVKDGQLTIGTDNPAYPPWFAGGEIKGSKWKINDPATGKGFESAVAYAVAYHMGFSKARVKWVYTPFAKAYAPGKKSFDFDINQVSFTPARAKVVAFSSSYYDVNQAIVALKGKPLASVRSVAGIRKYKLGAQLGTTSYQYIVKNIKPTKSPAVYDTNDAAVAALKNGQIDGLVVDLPTAFYVTAAQIENSKIVGQFKSVAGGEHFGLVLQKGSPLTACVNQALAALKQSGQLKQIQQTWLAKVTGAPVLK